jgi:pyruvate formate lyase activating enzyme|tara:strand:- start:9744 stop:10526 length:783 start_codon:yes stop_codon:yes gene_type:complete
MVVPATRLIKTQSDAQVCGRIHSVDTFGTVDGPGVRYVIFLQGCLFRCLYCHNRDTWDLNTGELKPVDEVLADILKYRSFFESADGGVTITGGEPILQIPFIAELFERLDAEGIHTCLDTNGYASKYNDDMDRMLAHTKLVMLDIKHIDEDAHKRLTKVSNARTLRFADYLTQKSIPTWVRHVVVPGYSDDMESIAKLADFLKGRDNVEKIELLPYHNLGTHKWQEMGEKYELEGLEPPSKAHMKAIKQYLEEEGFTVQL